MVRTGKIVSIFAILLVVVLAVSAAPANVSGTCDTDVWVAPPPQGNDANPGTQSQPFEHIQTGINNVCTDGTVHVAAGTYHENLFISGATNLTGAGAHNTIIDGGSTGTVINISSGPVTNMISGFTIQNGAPFGSYPGGGIYTDGMHIVTLNDCVIKDNQADYGGGIYNLGQLYMNRCTVSGNSAVYGGGGIYNTPGGIGDSGQAWLDNCTISGNKVTEFDFSGGGGIYNYNGTIELLNCTIAYNSTSSFSGTVGGGFYNYSSDTMYFKNTIVANNTAGNDLYNNGHSSPAEATVSQGYNLDSENSCGFDQPTDKINTDPLLGPLQDNGGPTFTHALMHGSPAIDNGGDPGITDQRGVPRPQGPAFDIGAYELEQAEVAPPVGTQINVSPTNPNNWTRLNPPTMSVAFVSVNPQQAVANQPVIISTNVVNTGDQGGNMSVALKINGQVAETRMVSVGPQTSQPIKFTVTRAQPGTYAIDIGGQTGSFTIPDNRSASAPMNRNVVILIAIGVLAFISAMIFILSRRPA